MSDITASAIQPNRPDPPGRFRASYDWSTIVLGEWQNWQDLRPQKEVTKEEALQSATRIRVAAIDYAKRHGMRVESRRLDHGKVLDLRFTMKEGE